MGKDIVNQMETRVEIERFKAECGIQGSRGLRMQDLSLELEKPGRVQKNKRSKGNHVFSHRRRQDVRHIEMLYDSCAC